MRRITTPVLLLVIMLLSACPVFLGSNPDADPQGILYSLWKDFSDIHACLDIRMSNSNNYNSWHDVYHNDANGYSLAVYSGMSDRSLFDVCARMIGELHDPHVGLYAPDRYSSGYEGRVDSFDRNKVRDYLIDGGTLSADNGTFFLYGVFSSTSHVGYIHIASFDDDSSKSDNPQDWARAIDGIIESLLDSTDAIIVDVRGNHGGLSQNAEYIAARFAATREDYMKMSTKNGPGLNDFSAPLTRTIYPAGTRYTKRIALLTNGSSVSAAEWFAAALRTQHSVTHVGTTTRGAFSPKAARPMINGWYYTISDTRVTDTGGICYEGIGIKPSVVLTDDDEKGWVWLRSNPDRQLEKVLDWLLSQ